MHLMVHGALVSIQVQPLLGHAIYADQKRFQGALRLYRHTAGQAAFIPNHHRHKDIRNMLFGHHSTIASAACNAVANPTAASAAATSAAASPSAATSAAASPAAASSAAAALHRNKLGAFREQPMQGHFLYTVANGLSRKQNPDTLRIRRQVLWHCISLVSIHQYAMQR